MRIAISGTHHSGKSTLVEELSVMEVLEVTGSLQERVAKVKLGIGIA